MEIEIGLLLPGEEERGSLSGDGVCVPAGWRLSGGMAPGGSAARFGLFSSVADLNPDLDQDP
jgi:hypothetical protein